MTVLCVGSDDSVAEPLAERLGDSGRGSVVPVATQSDALSRLGAGGNRIDCVVSELELPTTPAP